MTPEEESRTEDTEGTEDTEVFCALRRFGARSRPSPLLSRSPIVLVLVLVLGFSIRGFERLIEVTPTFTVHRSPSA
jgi:hypothetical protein